nr:hypothetical protein [Tanacetum cinerariifolium]
MTPKAIKQLVAQRVADAFLTYDANRNSGNGNGNGNGNGDGDGSHDLGIGNRRPVHTTRGCTYKLFLHYQPLKCKGTEGAVEKYTGGLPDSIQGNVMASKPKMLQEVIAFARSLMDQKVLTYAARQLKIKRGWITT